MPDHGKDEFWKNRTGISLQPDGAKTSGSNDLLYPTRSTKEMNVLPERVDDIKDVELFKSFSNCMKKPITVQAVQMNKQFQVETLEGNYKTGKPGDYLMCGIDGELYICDKDIFERSYDWV